MTYRKVAKVRWMELRQPFELVWNGVADKITIPQHGVIMRKSKRGVIITVRGPYDLHQVR